MACAMVDAPRRRYSVWLIRFLVVVALVALVAGATYRFGRSLWHPLLVKAVGGTTVAQRLAEIRARHPDLAGLRAQRVELACFKGERRVDVYIDGSHWRSFPIAAASGHPGPKLRAGDRQVPEGVYTIDAVNPNSSFHLSLRISYPNADDRARSAALGITDPGGDIYIHGKESSIGCVAIGDDAIEQVFYVANLVDPRSVEVVIAPVDLRRATDGLPEQPELYAQIRRRLDALPSR